MTESLKQVITNKNNDVIDVNDWNVIIRLLFAW